MAPLTGCPLKVDERRSLAGQRQGVVGEMASWSVVVKPEIGMRVGRFFPAAGTTENRRFVRGRRKLVAAVAGHQGGVTLPSTSVPVSVATSWAPMAASAATGDR